jgi:hypothetical protein
MLFIKLYQYKYLQSFIFLVLFYFVMLSISFANQKNCQVSLAELTPLLKQKNYFEAKLKIKNLQAQVSQDCWEYDFIKELDELVPNDMMPMAELEATGVTEKYNPLTLKLEFEKSSLAKDHVLLMTTSTVAGVLFGIYTFGLMFETDAQLGIPLSIGFGGAALYSAYQWIKTEPRKTNIGSAFTSGLLITPMYTTILLGDSLSQMSEKQGVSLLVGSSLLGGVGMSYWASSKKVSTGDVYLFDMSFVWSVLLTTYFINLLEIQNTREALLIGSSIGIGTGFAAASQLQWSAKRVGLINLGGLAGALVGLGLGALLDVMSTDAFPTLLTAAALTGMGTGIYLTDDVDDR